MIRLLFITLLALAVAQRSSLVAQPIDFEQQVDEYVKVYVTNGDFSGNVLVAKGDKVLFHRSYAAADVELNMPNSTTTKFGIASLTKTFTAAAIMMLRAQGALRLGDKLSAYIPEFVGGDSITLANLLLHQSGVADIPYETLKGQHPDLDKVVNSIKHIPLLFKPGTSFRYSNAGYLLLAYIVQRVSRMSYNQYVGDHLLRPLGMSSTGNLNAVHRPDGLANGYTIGTGANGIAPVAPFDAELLTGSGSMYSSTGDLLKWLKAIQHKKLFDVWQWPYPFGWGKRTYFQKNCIVQSGYVNGFSAYLALYPDDELYIACLSNISSNFNEDAGKDLAAIYYNQPYHKPILRSQIKVDNPHRFTGRFSWPGYKDFRVEQRGSDLFWRFDDSHEALPLTPLPAGAFLLRISNSVITFKEDENGVVQSLSFGAGDNAVICPKRK